MGNSQLATIVHLNNDYINSEVRKGAALHGQHQELAATRCLKTIMLIDDSEIDQMLHRRIVERSGLAETIQSYLSAHEALAYMKSDQLPKPDLILLDINMPQMDGFDFLEAISRLSPEKKAVVIIMLSASQKVQDEERASEYCMVKGFTSKPLSRKSLEVFAQI